MNYSYEAPLKKDLDVVIQQIVLPFSESFYYDSHFTTRSSKGHARKGEIFRNSVCVDLVVSPLYRDQITYRQPRYNPY